MNDADVTSAGMTSAGMTGTAPTAASTSYGTEPGDPSRADIVGGAGEKLPDDEVTAFVTRALARADLDDKRVCLVVPDGTRTCPLPLLMRAAQSALEGRAKEVTVVIALGRSGASSAVRTVKYSNGRQSRIVSTLSPSP